MPHNELARLLRRLPVFSSLAAEEAVALAARCTGLRYKPGMRIFTEGEYADSVTVVVNGLVQISISVPDGPDLVVSTESPGALIGEMALIDPAPRAATATAIEETVVLTIDATAFADLLAAGHPGASGILRTIALQVCTRLRALESKLDRLLTGVGPELRRELMDTRERMAR
ncbi:MAG: cyclic nucleotide-binding domain-containing protein [Myxococcales bacterium]|nr:cyclic nucleotide-binding domain-containing protein [Myxococcales bacterium]